MCSTSSTSQRSLDFESSIPAPTSFSNSRSSDSRSSDSKSPDSKSPDSRSSAIESPESKTSNEEGLIRGESRKSCNENDEEKKRQKRREANQRQIAKDKAADNRIIFKPKDPALAQNISTTGGAGETSNSNVTMNPSNKPITHIPPSSNHRRGPTLGSFRVSKPKAQRRVFNVLPELPPPAARTIPDPPVEPTMLHQPGYWDFPGSSYQLPVSDDGSIQFRTCRFSHGMPCLHDCTSAHNHWINNEGERRALRGGLNKEDKALGNALAEWLSMQK